MSFLFSSGSLKSLWCSFSSHHGEVRSSSQVTCCLLLLAELQNKLCVCLCLWWKSLLITSISNPKWTVGKKNYQPALNNLLKCAKCWTLRRSLCFFSFASAALQQQPQSRFAACLHVAHTAGWSPGAPGGWNVSSPFSNHPQEHSFLVEAQAWSSAPVPAESSVPSIFTEASLDWFLAETKAP